MHQNGIELKKCHGKLRKSDYQVAQLELQNKM